VLLNPPYSFHSASAVLDAASSPTDQEDRDKIWEAVERSRTQHRQKTSAEILGLAEVVEKEGWDPNSDGSLSGLLELVKGEGEGEDVQSELRKLLKGKVKGVGDTAVDVFLRRVQGVEGWEGVGWFVDQKTRGALERVGMPGDAEGVRRLLGESVMEEKEVRKGFVVVLERALGVVLEGKQEELKRAVEGE